VKNNPIVSRIIVVSMLHPFNNRSVDLDISSIGNSGNADQCVSKIRSAVTVEDADIGDAHDPAVGSFQLFVKKVLSTPDMPEESLMNIERVFSHGMSLPDWGGQQTTGRLHYEKNLSRSF
jgi:hypothetical protein